MGGYLRGRAVTFCAEWGVQAAQLGWDAHSLFGANRHRPYARLDQCGLVGFLSRKRVIAMTGADVLMEVAWGPGAQRRYCRKDLCRAPGAVPLWQLAAQPGVMETS